MRYVFKTYHKAILLSGQKPSDPVRQSLPFTYVALEAQSTDGQLHSVQVYSDIGLGEFCSYYMENVLPIALGPADWVAPYPFNSSQVVHDTGNTVYWTARDLEGSSLAEVAGRGTDMTLYYGTPKVRSFLFGAVRRLTP